MSAWFPFKTQGKHQKGVHSKKGATCGRQNLPAFGTHALFRISPNEAAVSKSPRGQAFISAMFRRPLNLRLTGASIWQGSLATVIVIPVKETMTHWPHISGVLTMAHLDKSIWGLAGVEGKALEASRAHQLFQGGCI